MVNKNSNRWAILIGINGYHESLGPLKYSVNDCRRLAEVLTTGDDAFPADHVLVLADDEAGERKPTYANIHSWLASWLAQPGEDDTVLVFFAGHGREMDGKCYLVPGDATLQTIHVTGIPVPYIQELLNRCKARQKVLILDACHSGAGRDVSTMAAPMMETLSAGKGIYTLTSCDVDEASHEWDEKNQGVFSYYLAEALSGSCPPDAHDNLTMDCVYEWVYESVQEWAHNHRCSQVPKRICAVIGKIVLGKFASCSPHPVHTPRSQSSADYNTTLLRNGFQEPIAELRTTATPVRTQSNPPVATERSKVAIVLSAGGVLLMIIAVASLVVAQRRYGWGGYLIASMIIGSGGTFVLGCLFAFKCREWWPMILGVGAFLLILAVTGLVVAQRQNGGEGYLKASGFIGFVVTLGGSIPVAKLVGRMFACGRVMLGMEVRVQDLRDAKVGVDGVVGLVVMCVFGVGIVTFGILALIGWFAGLFG